MPIQLVRRGALKGRQPNHSGAVNQDVDVLNVPLEVRDQRRDVRIEPEIRLIAHRAIRGLLGDWLQGLHSSADKANCRTVRSQDQSDRLADSAICAGNHSYLICEMRHRPEITVVLELLSTIRGAAAGPQRHEGCRKLTRTHRQYSADYGRHPTGSAPTTSRFLGAFRRDFHPLRGKALGGLAVARILDSDCSTSDCSPKRKTRTDTSSANARGWPDPLTPDCR